MADAKKLKQNLTAIESATSQLAGELDKAYQGYLAVLAQSLRRQVVSACYSLCTRGYPERFLRLTTSQREQVQQTLQTAIAQSCAQLAEPNRLIQALRQRRLKASQSASDAAAASAEEGAEETAKDPVILKPREPVQSGLDLGLTIRAARVQSTDASDPEAQQADPQASDAQASDTQTSDAQTSDAQTGVGQAAGHESRQDAESQDVETEGTEPQAAESINAQATETKADTPQDGADAEIGEIATSGSPMRPIETPKTPTGLQSRQEKLEAAVTQVIDQLADDLNDHLREAGVLPQELPEAVLEAVIKTGAAEMVEGPPNVLSLMVRADEDGAQVSPVMAIRLQISELEFNDAHLSAKRSQLRSLYGKLRKLSQRYEKYQREWITVEAESAWRASWYEPS